MRSTPLTQHRQGSVVAIDDNVTTPIGHNIIDYDLRVLRNCTTTPTQVRYKTRWYIHELFGLMSQIYLKLHAMGRLPPS